MIFVLVMGVLLSGITLKFISLGWYFAGGCMAFLTLCCLISHAFDLYFHLAYRSKWGSLLNK